MSNVSKPNNGMCVFCGEPYANGHWDGGNNPEPVYTYSEARACDVCNAKVVIPARLGYTIIFQDGAWVPKDPDGAG